MLTTNSIIGLVTPDMLETIKWGTYIFFAAFCLIAFLFTYFFIPETRGKVCTIPQPHTRQNWTSSPPR